VRDWALYRERVMAGLSPEEGRETLDENAEALERTWLALRTTRGVALPDLASDARRLVDGWRRSGLADVQAERARLTPAGWLLLDRLAVELDGARGSGAASLAR
jgi:coproporphyrinogen III oxidase-like Fe-S oxidoreductase